MHFAFVITTTVYYYDYGFTIPNRERSKSIPYWKDNIKPLKDKALFWHWIWLESGKRYIGVVDDVMKHTRHIYHYAMRAAKRADSLMRRQRLAVACDNNNDKDMWKELKLMNPRQKVVSRVVDDAATGTDIANVFGRKYESVYNSSPTSADNMNKVREIVNERIRVENHTECLLELSDVIEAVRTLRKGKRR